MTASSSGCKHSARDGLQFYKRNRNFIIADILLSCSPSQEEIRATGENKYFIADMPITHTYRRSLQKTVFSHFEFYYYSAICNTIKAAFYIGSEAI